MGSVAIEGVSNNARVTLGLAQMLTADVPEERFGRFAVGTSGPVNANHPAWVLGHLATYPPRLGQMLGLSIGIEERDGWAEKFAAGVACLDDPEGTVYPSKGELLGAFNGGVEAVLGAIATMDESKLAEPTPHEGLRKRCPTLMAAMDFVLVAHPMMHLGQVSTWRRIEGLGSVM